MIHMAILFGTVLTLWFFSLFEPVKSWKQAFFERPLPALLYSLSFLSVFLGNMKGGNIQSYIPDTVRYLRMLVLMLLFTFSSTRLLMRIGNVWRAGVPILMMLFYALLAMVSASYSKAPLLSLWKGFEVFALVLVPISLSDELDRGEDLGWLLGVLNFILFFLALSVLVGLAVAPSEAIQNISGGAWAGFYVRGVAPMINPNSVSQIGAFVAASEGVRLLSGGKNKWPLYVSLMVTLAGHSRTSIFALILCFFFVMARTKPRWMFTVVPATTILLFLVGGLDVLRDYILRGQTEANFAALSGRTYLWPQVWRAFIEQPLIGQGFYAAHRIEFGISTVDNAHLEVLLGIGVVGYAVFLAPIIWIIFTLVRWTLKISGATPQSTYHLQLCCLFTILFVRSVTGPSFNLLHHNLIIYGIGLTGLVHFCRMVSKSSDVVLKKRIP